MSKRFNEFSAPRQDGKRLWITHDGKEVPADYVRPLDKKQDSLSRKLAKKADKLHQQLAAFKRELFGQCDDLYALMQADAHVSTGKKGNYTIQSFDKGIKIEISVQQKISWNNQVDFAKEKIMAYLKEQLSDKDKGLQTLVNAAFETSRGRLDTKRILGLMKLDIKHKLWQEGIELLKQAIDTSSSKRYARVWLVDGAGEYSQIDLNFSSL